MANLVEMKFWLFFGLQATIMEQQACYLSLEQIVSIWGLVCVLVCDLGHSLACFLHNLSGKSPSTPPPALPPNPIAVH